MNALKFLLTIKGIRDGKMPDEMKAACIMIMIAEDLDKAVDDALEKLS